MTEEKNTAERNAVKGGTLYITATPIGNMADITERAVKVLTEADFIAAEDTRVTAKLLNMLGIRNEVISYYEHNKAESGKRIIERLSGGESCALVTDAGTPAISDPGADLVAECAAVGITVVSIPGACAGITALTVSALPTGKFVFEGFIPVKGKDRRERLEYLKTETRTVVIYEAPHRLRETLKDLYDALGERRIAVCRELTKLNEEVMRCSLSAAVELYAERQPKGEYVLVLGGAPERSGNDLSDAEIIKLIEDKISEGNSSSTAVKLVAAETGKSKNYVYDIFISDKK